MRTEALDGTIIEELQSARNLLDNVILDEKIRENLAKAAQKICDSFERGGKVMACGNGGSHCDAMHFAEELSGYFREKREALPAMAISDSSHITCVANDTGFEYIYSRFIEGFGKKEDVLLVLSTSGNSSNIIEAVNTAKSKGIYVIGLTGNGGGKVSDSLNLEIKVPYNGYADRIQEVHIKILHILILLIEKIRG